MANEYNNVQIVTLCNLHIFSAPFSAFDTIVFFFSMCYN